MSSFLILKFCNPFISRRGKGGKGEKECHNQVSWMSRQSMKRGQSMKILGLFLLSSLPEGINETLELWPLF